MSHNFTINLTGSVTEALDKARHTITGSGGELTGDTSSGTFVGSGVFGSYQITGSTVTITINKKPFIAPMSLIESKVREFFK